MREGSSVFTATVTVTDSKDFNFKLKLKHKKLNQILKFQLLLKF